MVKEISKNTRNEIIEAIRRRYMLALKKEKTKILDEFIALSGYHRKHAVRLLGRYNQVVEPNKLTTSKRIYDEAVKEALIIIWEAADRICSKRIKAVIPDLIDAMERHGHLALNPTVRQRLLKISAATIDRLLFDVRIKAHQHKRKRKSSKKVSKKVPIRTFADWDNPAPGYLEIDFVAHSGGSMGGKFIHTLVGTDVSSQWIECVPLLAREQSLVVEALEVLRRQLPFTMLGIDFDNDSAFINDTLLDYCKNNEITFTRSRPFRKNDQAWVEQKNGAVIRRFVGYERFSGVVAGQALAHLYQNIRLYVNYFQPSFKLLEKKRQGAKIRKIYDKPATPYHRLLNHSSIEESTKKSLQVQRIQLDPVRLLHQIRDKQAALAALTCPDYQPTGPGRTNLEEFLAQLPILWRYGDARPTHHRKTVKMRYWRTREDPFKEVWIDVLHWLQSEPDTTAKDLFKRLQKEHPGKFSSGQLRTLQRRVREWRQILAKKLVYSCLDLNTGYDKIIPIGAKA
jgi:hypothetical protein